MPTRILGASLAVFVLELISGSADAHHGSEFLALEDYDIGHPGSGFLNSAFDWEQYGGIDELSAESGVFFTPMSRVGIGVDVRIAENSHGDWRYSSVTPRLHLQLTDPHSDSWLKAGISVGYQFAEDPSDPLVTRTSVEEIVSYVDAPVVQTVTTEVPPDPVDPGAGCDPLFDLDCAPSAPAREPRHNAGQAPTTTTSTQVTNSKQSVVTRKVTKTTSGGSQKHSGIHNHDSRQWITRLVIQTSIGKTKIAANLIGTFPDDDQGYWGYGIGARRGITDRIALSLEAVGDLSRNSDRQHEFIASAHYEANESLSVRCGAGSGLGVGDNGADFTLRAGLLWRF
ncbi:MAG: hypothetical protein KDN22_13065 [Verrucomicrobiae bacterium]|nr:hypothetical protein [Verrucomicrobiae bacterium]